jgi:hypothetical protein
MGMTREFKFRNLILRAGHQWLTPVVLATQEAEIRRIAVGSQPRQIVLKTLSPKNSFTRKD